MTPSQHILDEFKIIQQKIQWGLVRIIEIKVEIEETLNKDSRRKTTYGTAAKRKKKKTTNKLRQKQTPEAMTRKLRIRRQMRNNRGIE